MKLKKIYEEVIKKGIETDPRSKQEIAAVVWPEYHADVGDYQVESLIKRLREKLEPDPRNPVLILTVRGRGYKVIAGR